MENLISRIYAYNSNEKTDLELLKSEIQQENRKEVFWYVSSGTDPHPIYCFKDIRIFIYSDYSLNINKKICKIYSNQITKPLYFSSIYERPADDNYYGSDILIDKILPVNIFSNEEFIEVIKLQQRESTMVMENCLDSTHPQYPQGFIIKATHNGHKFIVIFLNLTNAVCYSKIIARCKIDLKYLCIVCDGCSKGGNWECSNNENSHFFQTVIHGSVSPHYWVTEHNWVGNKYFSTMVRKIEKDLWSTGYNSAIVKVFEFNKKTVEKYVFKTNSYTLSLINHNILACLDFIEDNTLFVTSLRLPSGVKENLKNRRVIVIDCEKMLKGEVTEWISYFNRLAEEKGVKKIITTPFGTGNNTALLEMDKYTKGKSLTIKELNIYYMDKDDYADIRVHMKKEN